MNRRVLLPMLALSASGARGQAPFTLDTAFRAEFQTWYVASALPLDDGKILIAGQIHEIDEPFPFTFKGIVRLNSDGTWDDAFNASNLGQYNLKHWQDRFYASSTQTVRRILYTGDVDPTFIPMNTGPYFTSLQGGDYHVFPDGRVVMSGMHMLNDPVRGFVGDYNFIWFSNQGYLDTTRTHRNGNGALYDFIQLPDGKFIAGTTGSAYDGRPTSRVQRMHADGSLDTTFFAGVQWGEAQCFLPASDGRVYAGGMFGLASAPTDTLHLVRFLPNGDLDPSFNNHLSFEKGTELDGTGAIVFAMSQLADDRILVLGRFVEVGGEDHFGLAVVDTTGALVLIGAGTGCGPTTYQGYTSRTLLGASSGAGDTLYVFGNYHGYTDGVVHDSLQRFVSRLNMGSLYVGKEEQPITTAPRVYPNPTSGELTIEREHTRVEQASITLSDMLGSILLQQRTNDARTVLNLNSFADGLYHIELRTADGLVAVQLVVVQH